MEVTNTEELPTVKQYYAFPSSSSQSHCNEEQALLMYLFTILLMSYKPGDGISFQPRKYLLPFFLRQLSYTEKNYELDILGNNSTFKTTAKHC